MYGQPLLDLATGHPVAVECLLRWHHPVRGVLPPSEFLAMAERSPMMIPIGRRVLTESCRMAAGWCERFGAAAPNLHINVSGRQLESGHLIADVLTALATYGLPAGRLVLELTETHLPAIADSLRTDLDRLRERGVRIAIDDIGTGYSSLARITELPVDMLKIDLKFVAGLGVDRACDAVVRAVLSLGSTMGLSVVAEGVETPQQAELLRSYGCDTVQGYLYSPPRPEADLLHHLAGSADRAANPPQTRRRLTPKVATTGRITPHPTRPERRVPRTDVDIGALAGRGAGADHAPPAGNTSPGAATPAGQDRDHPAPIPTIERAPPGVAAAAGSRGRHADLGIRAGAVGDVAMPGGPGQPGEREVSVGAGSASSSVTSDSRNLRCPPGVRMDPIRPWSAHRYTVFGSTRNNRATSPDERSRSGMSMVTGTSCPGPGQGRLPAHVDLYP